MRNPRSLGLALSLWFALIAVGSTVVWTVISGTGSQLVGSDPLYNAAAPATSQSASPTPTPQGTVPGATLKPSPTPSAEPSSSTPSSAAPTSSSSPRADNHDDGDHSEGPHSHSTPPPDKNHEGAVAAVKRSWSGDAGTVIAECTGPALDYYSVIENGGYSVDVEKENNRLKVQFKSNGKGEDVEVDAWCQNGVPVFDDHGDHGVHSDSDEGEHTRSTEATEATEPDNAGGE